VLAFGVACCCFEFFTFASSVEALLLLSVDGNTLGSVFVLN